MGANSKEPTRPIGEAMPSPDGTLRAKTILSPKACKVRARLDVPPSKVMPIIVVPGIMGSNLRASTARGGPANSVLRPGDIAWRAPNDSIDALAQAREWSARGPARRQRILDAATLEVDPDGPLPLPQQITQLGLTAEDLRKRGWGEVHWGSYGKLLWELLIHFRSFVRTINETRNPAATWSRVNSHDRSSWGRNARASGVLNPLSIDDLSYLARYGFPVYAFGYNWLQSNGESACLLRQRIEDIIGAWTAAGCECRKVILVTHSMGGLVARACAKTIEEKIAGIVHGCMPALGAPVCYRRIACGMEPTSPSNGMGDDLVMDVVSDIVGKTTEETTPAMAFAPGALELLPTHRYPAPWLFISRKMPGGRMEDVFQLPQGDPYALYCDFDAWYRAIDPALADPAGRHIGQVVADITKALNKARHFHQAVLGDYYHPRTYAFFGADSAKLSYGVFRWVGDPRQTATTSQLQRAKSISTTFQGGRNIQLPGGATLFFSPAVQDAKGDGTVPEQSGNGPERGAKAVFGTAGYSHQGSYANDSMRMLTIHLVARIAREA